MKFGSVCSGIEAASVAWGPLGWEAAWFSEIEPFPCAVLAHHYPHVPNHGDMTLLPQKVLDFEVDAPDILCGGTPCQAFSVAGLRRSLDDARGNLSLTFCELANAIDTTRAVWGLPPAIIFWENVPGVLSTKDNAFGCFLAGLAGEDLPLEPPGGKWTDAGAVLGPTRAVAWRTLDAQFFALAQRRKRVFVVASSRDGFDPVEVLLEFDGVRRDSPPSRQARKGTAGGAAAGVDSGRWWDGGDVAATITTKSDDQRMPDKANAQLVVQPLAFKVRGGCDGGGKGYLGSDDAAFTVATTQDQWLAQPISFPWQMGGTIQMPVDKDLSGSLIKNQTMAVAIQGTLIGRGENAGPQGSGADVSGAMFTLTKTDVHAVAFGVGEQPDIGHCLRSGASKADKHESTTYVAQPYIGGVDYENNAHGMDEATGPLLKGSPTGGGRPLPAIAAAMQVRRLTPTECERLQGFPDGYTNIPWRGKPESPDGPRYKALGNSWAVPNVRWIGRRIDEHGKPRIEEPLA